ncbi:MAG: class I tRNA ligase family protein, partial [Flavobacteriales bacterium]
MKYRESKHLDLTAIHSEIQEHWEKVNAFHRSVNEREGQPPFVFYEGPPSANGLPGIHHVMARAIKDVFCRYQTLNGKQVKRKAGWDTHGLPIELAVEKTLGITKEDIGHKISVEEYNAACRKEVMKYTDTWEELTRIMGYWVDMENPYVTYENSYIETVWYLLQQIHRKNLLYQGFTIQPYSPAAGTGLSSHELNQPGCYRNVKDTSAVAMFKVKPNAESNLPVYILAWTTTPWTLPSNTALAVGKNIAYLQIETLHPQSHERIVVVMAKDLLTKYFAEDQQHLSFEEARQGDKKLPYRIHKE